MVTQVSPPSKHGDGMKKYPFICSVNDGICAVKSA